MNKLNENAGVHNQRNVGEWDKAHWHNVGVISHIRVCGKALVSVPPCSSTIQCKCECNTIGSQPQHWWDLGTVTVSHDCTTTDPWQPTLLPWHPRGLWSWRLTSIQKAGNYPQHLPLVTFILDGDHNVVCLVDEVHCTHKNCLYLPFLEEFL